MDQPITVRLATPFDAEGIALESMAEIEHDLQWEWSPQRVLQAIDDPDTNVVVAVDDGSMLGFGIMLYKDEVAHLLLFAVRADARRRGVGTSLLRWLEEVAGVAGVSTFRVEARQDNLPALAFYRSHGYSEVELVRSMYQDSVDGVRLQKTSRLGTGANLQTIDRSGKLVSVGTLVRVLNVPMELLAQLSSDEAARVKSMKGAVLSVCEVDQSGSAWVEKWWNVGEGDPLSHAIALTPLEMEVVAKGNRGT
ncbi:hypothetical protein BWI17_12305 [Betaproteobacteria bacterium GR16-43]|nr:hypothetical protein BWI17_12305 [Betaproteobacteria bacterium GR16-43]